MKAWPLLILIVLAGCGSPEKVKTPAKEPAEKPLLGEGVNVNTGTGEALIRSRDLLREPRYHLKWQSARIQTTDQGIFAGSMEAVSGEFYQDGKVQATFSADHAQADKNSMNLTISGNVSMTSKTRHVTLTCDKIVWHDKDRIAQALGKVTVSGEIGRIGPADELWANSRLDKIATPNMFDRP